MHRTLKTVNCMAFNDDERLLRRGLRDHVVLIEIVDTRKSEVVKKFHVAGCDWPIMKGVNYVLSHFTATERDLYFVGIFDTGKTVTQSALWSTEDDEANFQGNSFPSTIFGERFT